MNQLTRHDQSIRANKGTPRSSHTLLAVRRQRDVARACVPSVQRPLCLAVPDDEAPWRRHGGIPAVVGIVILVRVSAGDSVI
jgi:hypothetical protein